MNERFARTAMLLGEEAMERLSKAKVAVFGIGGVGGYAAEALARSGVGALVLVDHDKVSLSNINRQIIALENTLDRYKVDVMAERIHSINPEAYVESHPCFYLPENAEEFDFSEYDYVIDAVDTVTAKLEIISRAKSCGIPVISSMGAGNKLDPTKFQVADISKTSICPLAKVMRRECKKRGIKGVKVVYSTEEAITPKCSGMMEVFHNGETSDDNDGRICVTLEHGQSARRSAPGSVAFVPSVAGLILAGEVIKDLAGR